MRDPAENAQLALLLEVTGTPKPGNVDRHRDYPELRFEHFAAGAVGGALEGRSEGGAVGGHLQTRKRSDGAGGEVLEPQSRVVAVSVHIARFRRARHLQQQRQLGVLGGVTHPPTPPVN